VYSVVSLYNWLSLSSCSLGKNWGILLVDFKWKKFAYLVGYSGKFYSAFNGGIMNDFL
jgi:hypothetical protein